MSDGKGHPLPASEEARHGEIPESLEERKGEGDDAQEQAMPHETVNPDGTSYPSDDLGRGPGTDGTAG